MACLSPWICAGEQVVCYPGFVIRLFNRSILCSFSTTRASRLASFYKLLFYHLDENRYSGSGISDSGIFYLAAAFTSMLFYSIGLFHHFFFLFSSGVCCVLWTGWEWDSGVHQIFPFSLVISTYFVHLLTEGLHVQVGIIGNGLQWADFHSYRFVSFRFDSQKERLRCLLLSNDYLQCHRIMSFAFDGHPCTHC